MSWLSRLRDRLARGTGGAIAAAGAGGQPADLSLATTVLPGLAGPVGPFDVPDEPAVSIVIPAHGHLDLTLRCLASICKAKTQIEYEVIVVDDGTTPPLETSLGSVVGLRVVRTGQQVGFVGAANEGARNARAALLLFLNNDTVVTDGWLDALWRRLAESPSIGLVGAQLVSPNGRVQEAGGIVWNDGSATNYGRGRHPDEPEVAYAREVDYCSGACLLVRRDLFREAGEFDPIYAPGYYEDVDLSFEARTRGFTTWFEPAARVYHEEGATAGTDPARGMKRSQEANRGRFSERWKRALEQQPARAVHIDLAKDRGVTRRALVVDHRMPTPDRDAGSSRLVRLLEDLLTLGFRPTLAPYDLVDDSAPRRSLEAMGVEVLRRPWIDHLDRYLKGQPAGFDVVVLSRLGVAQRLTRVVRRRSPDARILFDTVDLKSVRDGREAELLDDRKLRRRAEQTRKEELEVIRSVDATLVTSRVERDYLRQEAPEAPVALVPTWYPIARPELSYERRSGALFIGGFRHRPNVDGLGWFLSEVMPRVQQLLPGFVLHIVGEEPPRSLTRFAGDQVIFHGYVADVSSYFQRARMSVAPLRFGAGLKGKVHQSLANGLPCVATPVAAEGLGLMPAVHVALAETASEFADAVLQVDSNIDLWQRLSVEGLEHVDRYFSAEVARTGLAEALGFIGG